jgi:hypothetical protein
MVGDESLRATSSFVKGTIDGHASEHTLVTTEGVDRVHSHRHFIPARQMRTVATHFSVFPPIISGNEALIVDVIFTGNYEDEHRVRSATFKPVR